MPLPKRSRQVVSSFHAETHSAAATSRRRWPSKDSPPAPGDPRTMNTPEVAWSAPLIWDEIRTWPNGLELMALLGGKALTPVGLTAGYGHTFRPRGAPGWRSRRRSMRRHGHLLVVRSIARLFDVPPRLIGRTHAHRLPLSRL